MGKRRLLWALWLVGAGLLWLFENNAATLALLAASVVLPASSILAAALRRPRLRGQLTPPDKKGAEAGVGAILTAEPAGFWSRTCGAATCENRLTEEKTETEFSLPASLGKNPGLPLRASSEHCGTLRLSARVWTEDWFGLWRSRELSCGTEYAALPPELVPLTVTLSQSAPVSFEGETYSSLRPGTDPGETFGIREYVPGDPIRQIHWKLSQKTDKLLLRELGLPVAEDTLLLFRNTRREGETVSPEAANAMAVLFLSLSRALLDEGLVHTAAFAEGGQYVLLRVQSETDFREMEGRFLALGWEAEEGALPRLLEERPHDRAAIVCTAAGAAEPIPGDRPLTLLAPGDPAAAGDGVTFFSPDHFREELRYIVL